MAEAETSEAPGDDGAADAAPAGGEGSEPGGDQAAAQAKQSEPEPEAEQGEEPEAEAAAEAGEEPGRAAEQGEEPEPEAAAEAGEEPGPAPEPGASAPSDAPFSIEGMMEALRQAKVAELLLSTISTLASVAYGKLELGDLPEAKTAIDAIGALVPLLSGQIDDGIQRDVEQALTNLRLTYADAVSKGK